MRIHSLKLTNFRSHKKAELVFGQNNIIVGPNAQGKTNLLEAVYMVSVGKSFRTKEADIVRWGEEFFRIEAEAQNEKKIKVEMIYEKNVGKGRKTIKVNGVRRPLNALLGGVRCVFFTPDEVDMFFAFPSHRRRHINVIVSQTDKEYARNLIKYKRILEQRNTLLKRISKGASKPSELEVWDGRLAEHGAIIMEGRRRIIEDLNRTLAKSYKSISGSREDLKIKYEPSIGSDDSGEIWGRFIEELLASRERDILAKSTTKGPHRDDFSFFLGRRPVLSFASRGEMRSFIIALKFAERDILREGTGEQPVLLLDDVFSELDEDRRRRLVESFNGQQTLITTTDLDHIDKSLRKDATIFAINNGKIVK